MTFTEDALLSYGKQYPSINNLQGTSEKVELELKSIAPNVDIWSSSINESSVDHGDDRDRDDSTASPVQSQQEDFFIAQDRLR